MQLVLMPVITSNTRVTTNSDQLLCNHTFPEKVSEVSLSTALLGTLFAICEMFTDNPMALS